MKFRQTIKIQEVDFDVNKENEKLIINNSGALVCFVGTVRGNSENSEEIFLSFFIFL